MDEKFSLKDELFNATTLRVLADDFGGVLDADAFHTDIMEGLLPLELMARIEWIAEVLARHLPDAFEDKATAIFDSLPPPLDPTRSDDDFGAFIYAPLGHLVATYGVEHHRDLSFRLIEAITQRFSMEWAMRPFLNRWPDEAVAQMEIWADHENYHVRRLASEGTRPKLPWGKGIKIDPILMVPILDKLHDDRTRYVTRSVSNHLNDIGKFSPDVVIDRLATWRKAGAQDEKELRWMDRHALRTLIKNGHAGAMAHLGYRPDPDVRLVSLTVTPDVIAIGNVVAVEIEIEAGCQEPVIIDYAIHFLKSNGTTAPKVFKVKDLTLEPNKPVTLKKKHRFKCDATTFRLYPGAHFLTVTANGKSLGRVDFTLV